MKNKEKRPIEGIWRTNDDCIQCCCSFVIHSDDSVIWKCKEGHEIEKQLDQNKKGCKLPKDNYYIIYMQMKLVNFFQ